MDLINNMNKHKMATRSKTGKIKSPTVKMSQTPPNNDDIDEYGNLAGFIDYDEDEEFTLKGHVELQRELSRLSRGNILTMEFDENDDDEDYKPKKDKKKKNKIKTEIVDIDEEKIDDKSDMGNLLMSYILNKANAQLDTNREKMKRIKKLKKQIKEESYDPNLDLDEDLDIQDDDDRKI